MIEVKDLNKSFGNQHVLRDMNFEIPKGSVVGFLGPNGAGKSTTMKILTGYLQADSGSVLIDGQEVHPNNNSIKNRIGYLPEHNPLYKDMYIKEYLYYVAGIYKLADAKIQVEQAIKKTGLGPEQHKKIHQLSKGYRQRVGIAQSIIHNPDILILDEPTSGLDPNQIVDIRNLIIELGKDKTIMLSTHIMQEVEAMCQRVLIIGNGSIVKDEKISNAQNGIHNNKVYEVAFNQAPDMEALENIEGLTKIKTHTNAVLLVELDANASPSLFFDFAVEQKIKLIHLSKHKQELEQVFRKATQ